MPSIEISDPVELIDRLKGNPDVLAILRYGSGIGPDAADTDLCVVVAERPAGLESVHFWLEAGPVDMNIRTLEEICGQDVAPLPGLDDVLREGQVLFERRPGLLGALDHAGSDEPGPPSDEAVVQMRFGHAHYLAKLDHYRDRDPLLCDVLIGGAVYWLLHAYAAVRRLSYRGEKATLAAIGADDARMLEEIAAATGVGALAERIEALRRLTERVLQPVNGSWRKDEELYMADAEAPPGPPRQQWRDFFASLLAGTDRS